jgi:hypothetical protein
MRVTALLPGPQYAVTSTSSWSQAAVQAAVSQLVRMTRSDPVAAAGAPGGPGGPAPFRTRWARRTRRARRTGIALFARWTGDPGFPFWSWAALATTRQSEGERDEKRNILGSIHDGARSGSATMCCCGLWRKACRAIHAQRREAPARFSPGPALPWALGGQWGLPGTPQDYGPAGGLVPALDEPTQCATTA